MATFNVSSAAQLSAALASAHAGDTILLAGGSYGDVTISNISFSSQVTIESADPTHPAVFSSLSIAGSHDLTFENVEVHYVPNSTTVAWDSAITISNSSGVTIVHSEILGGLAVNGVPETATALDSTQDVIGMPAARAMTISNSSGIQILDNDISTFDRGIVLQDVTGLNISGNEIHGLRRTPIDGGDVSQTTIANNYIHDITPWHWGSGDHADFIHIWTVPTAQTGPSAGLVIENNYLAQGSGTAVLGIYLDDNNNGLGFTGAQIIGNVIYNGNAQGLRLESVMNSTVDGNVLIQSSGVLKVGPGIITAGDTTGLVITHNVLSGLDLGHLTGDSRGNILVQDTDPSLPNYDGMVEGSALTWDGAMQLREHLTGETVGTQTVPGADAGIELSSAVDGTSTGGTTSGGTTSGGTTSGGTTSGGTSTGGTSTGGTSTGGTDDHTRHFPAGETKTALPHTAESFAIAPATGALVTTSSVAHNSSTGGFNSTADDFVFNSRNVSSASTGQSAHGTAADTPQPVVAPPEQGSGIAVHQASVEMSFMAHDLVGLHQIHVDHLFS